MQSVLGPFVHVHFDFFILGDVENFAFGGEFYLEVYPEVGDPVELYSLDEDFIQVLGGDHFVGVLRGCLVAVSLLLDGFLRFARPHIEHKHLVYWKVVVQKRKNNYFQLELYYLLRFSLILNFWYG